MNTPAGRRYHRRLFPALLAYVAVLFACIWAIRHVHASGALLVLLSALPALPILAAIGAMGLYLVEETDEYLRQRIATCMLVGTAVLLAAATVYGFLANGGVVHMRPDAGIWAFPLWCASWGIARCVMGMRDRAAERGE